MIVGALEIMRGVRGTLMHPLLLPGAQGPDLLGYIVIAYEERVDLFDVLFVRGSRIEEYTCIHRELRALLTEKAVRFALDSCRMRCRVYLYALTRHAYNAFLSTFQCAPSLNVRVDGLSRKQIAALASGLRCPNGILEVIRPAHPFPSIALFRFHSQEEFLEHAVHVRDGRILAYDVELNAIVGERIRAGDTGERADESGMQSECPPATDPPAPEEETTGDSGGEPPASSGPAVPLPPPSPKPDIAPRITLVNDGGNAPPPLTPDAGLLVAAFDHLLGEFDRAGREITGARVERQLPPIIDAVLPGAGGFPGRVTSVASALKVLVVITQCVGRAGPIGKRPLRRLARDIVKEFYQNHQKLLYRCGVETEVINCYRFLAGERPGGGAL